MTIFIELGVLFLERRKKIAALGIEMLIKASHRKESEYFLLNSLFVLLTSLEEF